MDGKTVLGKLPVEFLHDPVPGDLGQDAGSGDAETETIPPDERGLFHGEPLGRQAIHQGMGRRMSVFLQSIKGSPHGKMGRPQDVQMTDFF